MNDANKALNALPILSPGWPCRSCGADQASAYNICEETQQVTDCNNCQHMKNNTHQESGKCWCHPELTFDSGKEGGQVWTHNMKQ